MSSSPHYSGTYNTQPAVPRPLLQRYKSELLLQQQQHQELQKKAGPLGFISCGPSPRLGFERVPSAGFRLRFRPSPSLPSRQFVCGRTLSSKEIIFQPQKREKDAAACGDYAHRYSAPARLSLRGVSTISRSPVQARMHIVQYTL